MAEDVKTPVEKEILLVRDRIKHFARLIVSVEASRQKLVDVAVEYRESYCRMVDLANQASRKTDPVWELCALRDRLKVHLSLEDKIDDAKKELDRVEAAYKEELCLVKNLLYKLNQLLYEK
jgi:hypothetical protein